MSWPEIYSKQEASGQKKQPGSGKFHIPSGVRGDLGAKLG